MKPGLYRNIPAEEYHKLPGLSSTGLKNMSVSPGYYWTMREAYREREQEEVLIHLILESPKAFEKQVVVVGDRRLKVNREKAEAATHSGQTPVSQELYDRIHLIRHSVETHPETSGFLRDGEPEVSMFWEHPRYGFECRGRVDRLLGTTLLDYKCVGATLSNPVDLEWLVYRQRWHWQADHYCDGFQTITGKQADFAHIYIDHRTGWRVKHPIEIRTIPASSMEKARNDYDASLFRYKECLENNDWSGIDDIFLPAQVMQ